MRSYFRFLFCFAALVLLISVGSNAAYAQRTYNRQWNVYPQWTRGAIQSVIDNARDGDMIYFNRGTYDFSTAPTTQNAGALQIIDKSLIVKGAPGSIIVGAPISKDPDTGAWIGIKCFWILNSDANKDVTFDGLTFRTFFNAIISANPGDVNGNPVEYPNLRNLVVKNCTFLDMKRQGIVVDGAQGNITISNNRINGDRASSVFGIYIDWFFEPGNLEWQPKNTLVTIANNSINGFGHIGGFGAGFLNNRASNMLITGNAISNSVSGIIFDDGLKNEAIVSNNTLSDLDTGIQLRSATEILNGALFQLVARGLKLTYNKFSNIGSWGIYIYGDLAHSNSIAFNKINMGSGSAIYSEGYDNQYMNNTIRGCGYQAVILSGGDTLADGGLIWGAHHEYFANNSVYGFTPQDPNNPPNIGWDYELSGYAHDNIVIGIRTENATYVDYGVNNIFKFVYPYVPPTVMTSLMRLGSLKIQNKPPKGPATMEGQIYNKLPQ
ncbi:MAG: right-handed parallel beta-helix repeat-containing protein [Deltaproteobacteria bacterium]|nr:right-handed parallel beta-helix repeat-containing protein [Deltaproteobacteria bacterium]